MGATTATSSSNSGVTTSNVTTTALATPTAQPFSVGGVVGLGIAWLCVALLVVSWGVILWRQARRDREARMRKRPVSVAEEEATIALLERVRAQNQQTDTLLEQQMRTT